MAKGNRTWRYRLARRLCPRGDAADRGASMTEYVGVIILVAGIIIAVRGLGLDGQIASAVSQWVTAIVGGG